MVQRVMQWFVEFSHCCNYGLSRNLTIAFLLETCSIIIGSVKDLTIAFLLETCSIIIGSVKDLTVAFLLV